MVRRFLPLLAAAAIVLGFGNGIWFLADVMRAGGVADHQAPAPPYRVNNHGRYTQVDQQTWEWLSVHGQTMVLTTVLALGGMAYVVSRLMRFAEDSGD